MKPDSGGLNYLRCEANPPELPNSFSSTAPSPTQSQPAKNDGGHYLCRSNYRLRRCRNVQFNYCPSLSLSPSLHFNYCSTNLSKADRRRHLAVCSTPFRRRQHPATAAVISSSVLHRNNFTLRSTCTVTPCSRSSCPHLSAFAFPVATAATHFSKILLL